MTQIYFLNENASELVCLTYLRYILRGKWIFWFKKRKKKQLYLEYEMFKYTALS